MGVKHKKHYCNSEKASSSYTWFISQTLAYADARGDGVAKVKIRNLKGQCIIWTSLKVKEEDTASGPKWKKEERF